MIVPGGKAIYGASIGILMLDTKFPRIPGDIGNALTWDFPVLYRVVRDASPERVVKQGAQGLRENFCAAARELAAAGVDGLATNCGFLSIFQRDLAEASGLPVAASSLQQVAMVDALLGEGGCTGVLTISAESLSPAHLSAAGVPEQTPIFGTDAIYGHFTQTILEDRMEIDVELARAELVQGARELVDGHPQLRAIVLECTNMTPFAPDIRAATGRMVFAMPQFIHWFQTSLAPRQYGS